MQKNILIRFPTWVGDIVMATPFLKEVKDLYPESRITVTAKPYAEAILSGSPYMDEFIPLNEKKYSELFKTISLIRKKKFDLCYLLTNSFRSALTIFLAGIPEIIGYKRDGRSLMLTDGPLPLKNKGKFVPVPMKPYYLKLLEHQGHAVNNSSRPQLFYDKKTEEAGKELFKKLKASEYQKKVVFNPGANFGASKCWPPESFARLSELILNKYPDTLFLIVGSPMEYKLGEAITEKTAVPLVNTCDMNVDLNVLKFVIRNSDLLITNDTGPRHFAQALEKNCLVLMGPTDARHTDSDTEKTIIIQKDLPCIPCHKKVCPLKHNKCMKDISPEEVLETIIKNKFL